MLTRLCSLFVSTSLIISYNLLFNNPKSRQDTAEPTINDKRYQIALPITKNTKIPPCGAISVQLNAIDIAPAIAEPTTQAGITRSGSAAANGIAPSVIKDKPMIKFVGPAFLSSAVNLF